eukprot:gene17897-biopygen4515
MALKIGGKAFRCWAPEAYNRVCGRKRQAEGRAEQKTGNRCRKGRAPADSDAVEREGYYTYLKHKYKGRMHNEDEEGKVLIWTDGSAVEAESGGRSAGAGIFYGDGNERNRSLAVSGTQTNQRAELTAVLHCLQEEERPMHIMTDSMYVKLGIERWRHKWRANAWYRRVHNAEEIDHADLGQQVDNLISRRAPGEIEISWLKGHGLPRHINQGLTTEIGIWGNNEADRLAGQASGG